MENSTIEHLEQMSTQRGIKKSVGSITSARRTSNVASDRVLIKSLQSIIGCQNTNSRAKKST